MALLSGDVGGRCSDCRPGYKGDKGERGFPGIQGLRGMDLNILNKFGDNTVSVLFEKNEIEFF